MSSNQKGKPQAARSKPQTSSRPQSKEQSKVVSRPASAPAIPWFFWAGLAVLIVGGAVLLGTILGANPPAGPASKAVSQSTPLVQLDTTTAVPAVTPDARNLLTNGFGEGNPAAAVKVVEFGDFQCPSCKAYYDQAFQQIKQQYIDTGKIYYYYKPFPLTNIHPKAMKAANLAVCAADSGTDKFFALHNLLYTNQDAWVNNDETPIWTGYLQQLGLEPNSVFACINSGKHTDAINANINQAINLQIPGTPEFYVNDTVLAGATLDTMRQAIEAQLAKGN